MYLSASSAIIVANSGLLFLGSLLALILHTVLDNILMFQIVLCGLAFVSNQGSELSSPVSALSLTSSSALLISVAIHASHLLIGTMVLLIELTVMDLVLSSVLFVCSMGY